MHLVRETYQRLFNKTPNIQIIHAGLECGLFKKPYPDMDMVSIGPTITGPHSRMSRFISKASASTGRC
jgi:dipeptidase D